MFSGCTSSSATYNGSQMSFQYPSDCEVKEVRSLNGTMVMVNKDSKTEVSVRVINNSTETKNVIANSSTYRGQETIGGVVCDVYSNSEGLHNYFFQKNGKNIRVWCGGLYKDTAKQIIQTIQ